MVNMDLGRVRPTMASRNIAALLGLRGEKLDYKSVAKEISKPPFWGLLKYSGHQRSKFTVFV